MDVKAAAETLGITSEGVRQRIRRGTLAAERDKDGRVYVWIDADLLDGQESARHKDEVLTRLEDEIAFLRAELATRDAEIHRRDAILLSLSEGMRRIGPPEPTGGPETASEGTSKGDVPSDTGPAQRRSWWRRFFGVEGR